MSSDLKRELTLLDVFCIATGAMMSSGLFILPGLAYAKAGPAVIFSYMLAGILCVPTLLSMAELTTAMPKAGGDYFYIMRGFGPLLGTVAGFSTWFSLSLKGAFALLGIGAYLATVTGLSIQAIALISCVLFVILNVLGVKEAGRFQVGLVMVLLTMLVGYVAWGMRSVDIGHFRPFCPRGLNPLFATASFVFISYGGLTKVVALAEEVKHPGRNLPLGMILSLLVTSVLYVAVVFVTIGVLNPESLKHDLTPISNGAGAFGGDAFKIVIGIGAFLAFISTANAGVMTASRYPFGMSRDKLLPAWFQRVSRRTRTPYASILSTGAFMILAISLLRLELLVKVASSVLIVLYIFANLTVILFRESKLWSYKPRFHAPFYPYLQVLGILGSAFLLIEMGSFVVFLTVVFVLVGALWYRAYAHKAVTQNTALVHVLERLVARDKELGTGDLLDELKEIVIQREGIIGDKFQTLIEDAIVLDMESCVDMEDFFGEVSDVLGREVKVSREEVFRKLLEREAKSSTVLEPGLAIPHVFVEKEDVVKVVLVRAKEGIMFPNGQLVHIAFVLVGSTGRRLLHLKILAAIAQITINPEFTERWFEADTKEDLRHAVLLAERGYR